MQQKVTKSQFHMWRALFALAHADNVIAPGEIQFMAEAMEDVPFSAEQDAILKQDIKMPRDIIEMFEGISDVKDQAKFFKFARELVWADGDYGQAEQAIMLKLMRAHVGTGKVDELIGAVDLELEDGSQKPIKSLEDEMKQSWKARKLISSFKRNFAGSAAGPKNKDQS